MDYKNGKIYAIRSYQTDDIYIGSTCSPLAKRLYEHRKFYRCYKRGNMHMISVFKMLEHPDHYIELLESFPCTNKNELRRRQGELIRSNNCVNKNKPPISGRSQDEIKKRSTERVKKWREDNKERFKQREKQYYQDNKERLKQYYQDNKERVKQYYQQNKEKILQQAKQKIKCDVCDCMILKKSFNRHTKTNKHIRNLNNQT